MGVGDGSLVTTTEESEDTSDGRNREDGIIELTGVDMEDVSESSREGRVGRDIVRREHGRKVGVEERATGGEIGRRETRGDLEEHESSREQENTTEM